MSDSLVVVGIDVAKTHVDVAVLGVAFKSQRFDNDAQAVVQRVHVCASNSTK